jgi:hypothetical protein
MNFCCSLIAAEQFWMIAETGGYVKMQLALSSP